MPYIGRTLGQGTRSRFLYTATAGQTTFSGSDSQSNTLAYADNNGLDCFQNGVLLKGGGADYTATTGTSVVLTTGASVNDVIEILVYDVFAIADHVKKSGDAMTGALTNIDVNGTELILDADGDTSIDASTDDTLIFKTNSNTALNIDANGHITKPLQPAFQAQLSANQNTFAINSDITIAFDSETFDQNADFNTSTYTFTAPVTGRYQLNAMIRINHVDNGAGYYQLYFISSNRTYTFTTDTNNYVDTDLDYQSFTFSTLADMDASDTVYVRVYQSGGSQQSDVQGGAGHSIFSGYLVA